MLEIGHKAPEFRGEGSTFKGVVEGLKHNKIFIFGTTTSYLDLGNINEYKRNGIVPFYRWRVIGVGLHWQEASTANEDPIIEFGRAGDNNAYATMTSAITGGEKFCVQDFQKYDPLGMLAPEVITETSATLAVTWTEGIEFNVWETDARFLSVVEAAVAGMTSGQIASVFVIEVDTGGKW